MQNISDTLIEAYIKQEEPYQSCGAFQYESQGKWLFDKVEGYTETILGLPLLPLIEAFKQLGVVHLGIR